MTLGTPITASITSGTSNTTPAVPNGSVGDLIVWCSSWGVTYSGTDYFTDAAKPTISGTASGIATHVGTFVGGPDEAWGVDVGKRAVSVWYAIATSATGTDDTLTFTISSDATNVVAAVPVRISRDTAKTIQIAATYGTDTDRAVAFAATGLTDVGCASGDLVISHIAVVPSESNVTTTLAWTGCTIGTAGNVATSNVASGNDVRMNVRYFPITAGTSSAAPTLTSGTAGGGAAAVIRIREVSAIMNAGPDQSNIEPYTTVTLDSSASVGSAARTWTQTAGTTVALSSTTATSPTFKAPGTIAGETLTFRVTDDATAAFDDVNVGVLPSSRRVKVGGVMVPVERRFFLT